MVQILSNELANPTAGVASGIGQLLARLLFQHMAQFGFDSALQVGRPLLFPAAVVVRGGRGQQRTNQLKVTVGKTASLIENTAGEFRPNASHPTCPFRRELSRLARAFEDADAESCFLRHGLGRLFGITRGLDGVLHGRADMADGNADRSGGFGSHHHQRPVWPEVFAFAGTLLAADKAQGVGVKLKQIFQHVMNTARRLGW